MNFSNNWRVKRNMEIKTPIFTPIANYYTDIQSKNELKESYVEKMLLNNFHLIPDPLKKNLADTMITNTMSNQETETPQNNMKTKEAPETSRTEFYPSLAGITNFFSGVFNIISGAVFQKRSQTPDNYYYDCFDSIDERERSPQWSWQTANMGDQNKIGEACDQFTCRHDSDSHIELSEMSDCRSAVAQCEDKLNRVRSLLAKPTKPSPCPSKYRSRRPRKVFVEPGSVLESFEDAISSEDFVSIPNEPRIQYYSPPQYHKPELIETDSPKVKTDMRSFIESQENELVKEFPVINPSAVQQDSKLGGDTIQLTEDKIDCNPPSTADVKQQLISSCEDKLSRLKALLQERRKKNTKSTAALTDSAPEPVKEMTKKTKKSESIPVQKPHDMKRLRNPRSSTDKRKKTKMRNNIQGDLLFAQEIEIEESSSIENSPAFHTFNKSDLSDSPTCKLGNCISPGLTPESCNPSKAEDQIDYFDEVVGRFRSTSTDSEDSFQIVFNDSPKRFRKPSDCDSEDSFIVFEDSPDSCYTSNEVFGETEESEEESDTDSDLSDSGCNLTCQMSVLSKTLGDLTDDSLYEDRDVTDFAASVMCEELPLEEVSAVPEKRTGLLLNAEKKLRRRDLPPKRVQFSSQPPKVHVMRVWAFAARQARAGHWEKYVLDRDRFKRRIADVDMAVSWVLRPQHRSRVMFQRFMPWWNQQKRKELAEKKEREEKQKEERLKIEQQTDSIDTQAEVIESQIPYELSKETGTIDSNSIESTVTIESEKKHVDLEKDTTESVNEPLDEKKILNNTEESKTTTKLKSKSNRN